MPHPSKPSVSRLFAGAACAAALLAATALGAQEPVTVTSAFTGLEGQDHGTVVLTQAPLGVLLRADLTGLPEGALGFHFHERGVCEPPFESAGDHFDPTGAPHGFFAPGGPEAGDMPNIHVPASGELTVEVFNTLVSLQQDIETSLLDGEGTALVIHSGTDDYATQPAGDAGDRVACAVIAQ